MLPAKLARLICLLHLPLDGHHWNDDFRVCRNNVIHEFTTFFSHKQQFNDDDKSCKLEAEMLRIASQIYEFWVAHHWNFSNDNFSLVGTTLHLHIISLSLQYNNESNWLCQVLSLQLNSCLPYTFPPNSDCYFLSCAATVLSRLKCNASAELFVIRGSKRKQPYFATCLTLQ